MAYKIVFMGSPDFSLQVLQTLVENYTVVGVVSQPDRPAGRGRNLVPPPVKILAEKMGLPIIQPAKLRAPGVFDLISAWNPDLILVAAYGQILRQNILDLPKWGCVNVHASILPFWRGSSPIQSAILHGDLFTGVTIMKMDAGMDTGPTLSQRKTAILPGDTSATLSKRLSEIGADLLLDTLPDYLSGLITPQPQGNEQVTYAPMIKKEDGLLDFHKTALELSRQVKAFNPWPSSYTQLGNLTLKVHCAHPEESINFMPGKTLIFQGFPAFGTKAGCLVLDEVQPSGKNMMSGDVFLRGDRNWESRA